ncbi:MAG TPA: molybdopterin molybdenumtransferase MoeA [Planctomycetes bacterium]|nr:molybdopterin molybdenumtransferase MoeA [Planctomycetota bacterium]
MAYDPGMAANEQSKKREMLSLSEAREKVLAHLRGVEAPEDRVPLDQTLGRTLTHSLVVPADYPAFDNSAMDGFALRAEDLVESDRLRLLGESLAGHPSSRVLEKGTCQRVMTGGVIPEGADAVVPVENTSGFEPDEEGMIRFEVRPQPGANLRKRGEIRKKGDESLPKGTRIRAAHLAILAHEGWATLPVARRPRVAILPTGDEIIEVDQEPALGQVRNCNSYALAGMAEALGAEVTRLPVAADAAGSLEERIAAALDAYDLVCTIGGVSMGTKDLVRPCFRGLGGEAVIEAIRIKPGKPTFFGLLPKEGRTARLLGLPGNPGSALTIFALLGAPLLRRMQGVPEEECLAVHKAALWFSKVRPNWRSQALPGRLRPRLDGLVVEHLRQVNSADFYSFLDADALILVGENQAPRDGDLVEWVPLP